MNENGEVPVFSFVHACDLVHQVHYDVLLLYLTSLKVAAHARTDAHNTKDIIRTKERTFVNNNIIGNIFGAGALLYLLASLIAMKYILQIRWKDDHMYNQCNVNLPRAQDRQDRPIIMSTENLCDILA